jgi:type I restriction enzyme M protein
MMLKGQRASNIRLGNSFSEDAFRGARYDYLLANPPFGVEWKKVQREIEDEHDKLGFGGRFGAGLPRINDGSFLFLQHMISKMKPASEGGSRLAIVEEGGHYSYRRHWQKWNRIADAFLRETESSA